MRISDWSSDVCSADLVGRVGVFVDPDDAQVKETAAAARLTAIQLHGDESPARVAAIKALTGLDVWKAVPVRTAADIADARAYAGAADLLLFDAQPPQGADLPGGLGLRFDWRLLSGYQIGRATVCTHVTNAPLVC